jgi:glutamate-1-semialdehyde 2,1-aminomutase
MGCVPPAPNYLKDLRELCTRRGVLLIFDEVMTGFRLAYGGAQEIFGIKPDLTTMGKIIGGGLPVGAYGGRRDIMNMVSPLGPVYQAGTLSGNPLAMAAGISTLKILREKKNEIYPQLESRTDKLVQGILAAAKQAAVQMTANRVGSMFTWFFTGTPVTDWTTASKADAKRFGKFHRAMLESGIYLPPSQFEAAFLSAAHSDADIDRTIAAASAALTA